jgi:hypothetical protein
MLQYSDPDASYNTMFHRQSSLPGNGYEFVPKDIIKTRLTLPLVPTPLALSQSWATASTLANGPISPTEWDYETI